MLYHLGLQCGLPPISRGFLEVDPVLDAKSILSKTKRGLSGFANGSRISAFPDTGSTRNVVSEAFVRELKLDVNGSPCEFKLGNSQTTKSIGELLPTPVQTVR